MADNRELALVLKLVADQFQSELKKSGGLVGDFQKIIGDWKTQLTAAGGALFAIAKSTANYGDELVKMSQKMGVSIADTAQLQHAAKLADTDLQGLSTSIGFLSKNMLAAAQGSQEAQQTFARLGVSVTTAQGQLKGTTEILAELSARFQKMPDGPEKTALAMQALGKAGKDVLPFLNSQLGEAFTEAEQLGLVMSETDAKAAERFNDELTKLQASMRGLLIQGSMPLVQSLTELSEVFRALTSNELVKGFFRGLAEQTVLFSNLIKQAAANVEFLFGKLSFDELKTKIKGLESEAGAKLLLLENPAAAEFVNGPKAAGGRPSGGLGSFLTDDQRGKEQERLAKAWNEIWQTGIRGQEIEAKLFAEVMQQWEDRAAFFESHEKRVAEGTQALREYAEAEFKRDDEMVAHGQEMQQRRGQMIHESTKLEVQIYQRSLAEQQAANRTFFDEWKIGMDKYVRDTTSGFGLGADLARRTAQSMEQGFRQFFFDVWDRKIQDMADVLESLQGFAKQVLGTVFSQLATKAVLTSFGFGAPIPAFATGGSFMVGGFGGTDSQVIPIRATPGERVTVETPGQQHMAGGGLNLTFIVNNQSNAEVGQPVVSEGPDGRRFIEMTIKNSVRGMIQNGDMDKPMNQRFGILPSPTRR